MVGLRWNLLTDGAGFSSLGAFKTYTNSMAWEEPGDSHPIINEWGEVWVVPCKVSVVPEPKHG
jgi:hypothetical protein